jgi:hypothetical protein
MTTEQVRIILRAIALLESSIEATECGSGVTAKYLRVSHCLISSMPDNILDVLEHIRYALKSGINMNVLDDQT